MHHCADHPAIISLTNYFKIPGLDLIISLFLIGISNGFTHCISMCGPIAVGQVSMRLMQIPKDKMTQLSKLKAGIAFSYYIGKAITYGTMGIIMSLLLNAFIKQYWFKLLKFGILIVLISIFCLMAVDKIKIIISYILSKYKNTHNKYFNNLNIKNNNLNNNLNLNKLSYLSKISKRINNLYTKTILNKINKLKLNSSGWQGLILGMLLGLIPCGLVYTVLATAVSTSSNAYIIGIAMLAFGIGTFPSLFIVSYFGQIILQKYKKIFDVFYIITMLFNAYILSNYCYSIYLSL